MSEATERQLTYEEALAELEKRITLLERGDLALEEALRAVEEGRRYLARCTAILDEAERRITISPEEPAGSEVGPALAGDEPLPDRDVEVDPEDIPF
ncbi:MAG TPA: exodeoxyribonuclease VII small subunit [Candidatus Dormibacteraeota bacterium]|nr:exodeoxyribonuclease VII small subunit [Candidatus Dormibacteraeota bacterium]